MPGDGYLAVTAGDLVGYQISVTRSLGHKHMAKHGVLPDPYVNRFKLEPADCCLVSAPVGSPWDGSDPAAPKAAARISHWLRARAHASASPPCSAAHAVGARGGLPAWPPHPHRHALAAPPCPALTLPACPARRPRVQLLASDGVFEVMGPDEAVNRVMDALTSGCSAQEAAQQLVTRAVDLALCGPGGDADNATAVVMALTHQAEA